MPIRFRLEEHIAASPERVFEVATDIERADRWMQNLVSIEKLTDGEVGVGAEWRETRKMFGKEAAEHFEVTHFEPPRRFDLFVDGTKGASKKGEYRFRHTLEPAGGGTRFVLEGEISGMGRIMEWFGRLFAGMFKKLIRKDMRAMKAYIEGGDRA